MSKNLLCLFSLMLMPWLQAQKINLTWGIDQAILLSEPNSLETFQLLQAANKQGFFKDNISAHSFESDGNPSYKGDFLLNIASQLDWYADAQLSKKLSSKEAAALWDGQTFVGLKAEVELNFEAKTGQFKWQISRLGLILQNTDKSFSLGPWTKASNALKTDELKTQDWAWRMRNSLFFDQAQGKQAAAFKQNLFETVCNQKKQGFSAMQVHQYSSVGEEMTLLEQKISPIKTQKDWERHIDFLQGLSETRDTIMLFDPETFMEVEKIILGPKQKLEHFNHFDLFWAVAYEPKTRSLKTYVDGISLRIDQYEELKGSLMTSFDVLYIR